MIDRQTLDSLLTAVCRISEEAGRLILEYYEKPIAVQTKQDKTPVTEADHAAHALIEPALAKLKPCFPVLSEESPKEVFADRRAWDRLWMVDPLDGTREFIRGGSGFSVNIALIENHEPVLGVIHIPLEGRTYAAARGLGAQVFVEGIAHDVNTHIPHRPAPVLALSPHRPGKRLSGFVEQIGEYRALRFGGAVKSCRVAEGLADLYPCFGPTSEWDTAAAQCLLEQAGGQLTNFRGEALRYNAEEDVRNPAFMAIGDPDLPWQQWLTAAGLSDHTPP